MKVTRKSAISGKQRTKDIPVNPNDWIEYNMGYVSIDESMPYLTAEDREFILSGTTPDEWQLAFSSANMVE